MEASHGVGDTKFGEQVQVRGFSLLQVRIDALRLEIRNTLQIYEDIFLNYLISQTNN